MKDINILICIVISVFIINGCNNCNENNTRKMEELILYESLEIDSIMDNKYVLNDSLSRVDYLYLSQYEPKEGFVPTAEIAYLIADAVLSTVYGRSNIEKQKPFSINLDGDIWIIDGYLKPGMKGGTAYMEISKKTGEILKVSHSK